MGEENTTIGSASIDFQEATANQESPFDRLESRIDVLIERYEQLVGEHNLCGEELAAKEARIGELEAQLAHSEQQRSEVRTRLDSLIDKLSRFS